MDLNLNQESEPQVWESWDLHKLVHPGRPQQCLVSYYEDDNPEAGLLTKMTFPTQVSYFIERNFALTVNGAHVPVYTKDGCNPVIYRLRNAQMCLIDRFIFIAISQAALEPLRSQTPIIVEGVHVFVKSMTSERLTIVFEGEMLELGYISFGNEEVGDVVWRLVITKLRDLTIEYWKRQVYQRDRHELCLLTSFLKYTVKLFTKFVLT
uniref:Uncharacterized protein n=2 Tax=Babesia bovis TaxID=5865 RepID=A7ATG2_BABBO|eukprot:XP_001609791.1 hypothetical protein [Babesia bovis T2Bo]